LTLSDLLLLMGAGELADSPVRRDAFSGLRVLLDLLTSPALLGVRRSARVACSTELAFSLLFFGADDLLADSRLSAVSAALSDVGMLLNLWGDFDVEVGMGFLADPEEDFNGFDPCRPKVSEHREREANVRRIFR